MVYDYLVIGGGISGLAAGFKCQSLGLNGVVLEAGAGPGGCISSICRDDFCAETGSHTIFNSYRNFLSIYEKLEIKPQIITKNKLPFLVWREGEISPLKKHLSLIELGANGWKIFFLSKKGKTVKDYYGKIVGNNNFTRLIKPALDAVSCQDCGELPADFLFNTRKKNRSFPRKFSFKGGISALINSISAELDVRPDSQVNLVQKNKNGFSVHVNDEVFQTNKLIIATPPDRAKKLTAGLNLDSLFENLNVVKFYSVLIIAPVKHTSHISPSAGWIGVNAEFLSMVTGDPLGESEYRAFTFHFRPAVTAEKKAIDYALSRLGLDEAKTSQITVKRNILPVVTKDFNDLDLRENNIGICGNYINGMSIEDCVTRSFAEVARLWQEKL